jgi:hypothetical protein
MTRMMNDLMPCEEFIRMTNHEYENKKNGNVDKIRKREMAWERYIDQCKIIVCQRLIYDARNTIGLIVSRLNSANYMTTTNGPEESQKIMIRKYFKGESDDPDSETEYDELLPIFEFENNSTRLDYIFFLRDKQYIAEINTEYFNKLGWLMITEQSFDSLDDEYYTVYLVPFNI